MLVERRGRNNCQFCQSGINNCAHAMEQRWACEHYVFPALSELTVSIFGFNSYACPNQRRYIVFRRTLAGTTAASEVPMRRWLGVMLVCMTVLYALGQAASPKYEPGTITAVAEHRNSEQHDADIRRYDVSIKVGNTIFMVLFTPPNGSNAVSYALGDEFLVLVGPTTLTFNNASVKTVMPILNREVVPAKGFDWSKVPSQYLTMMLQCLSENLAVSDAQQAQIKPVLEQEAGEVEEVWNNPAFSPSEQQSNYQNIVRASDVRLKPLLSASQLGKLQDLRKQQKLELKHLLSEPKNSKPD